jgi:hypothetical protein
VHRPGGVVFASCKTASVIRRQVTAPSGAGWVVPKKYVEKVGDEGFKNAPVMIAVGR